MFKHIKKLNHQDLAVKFNNKKIMQIEYHSSKFLNNEELSAFVENESQKLYNKGTRGKMQISAKYLIGYRSGRMSNIGGIIDLFNPNNFYDDLEDEIEFDARVKDFTIYYYDYRLEPEGGNSKFNDCLYYCLKDAFQGDTTKLPKEINKPWKLKKFLNLNRNDKINISLIKDIEELLNKTSINIHGDFTYTSTKEAVLNINLSLKNAHYTLLNNEGRTRTKGTHFKAVKKEKVYVYQYGKEINIYNGILKIVSPDKFNELKSSFDYIFIKCIKNNFKQTRDDFLEKADKMLELSENRINLYKYGSIPVASLDIWRYHSKLVQEPEPINLIEDKFLNNSFRRGLTYHKEGNYENAILYDVNSFYPSFMNSYNFMIPMKAGEELNITSEEFNNMEFFKFGIYRVHIEKSNDILKDKFFLFNNTNYYWHHDLKVAKELNLKINLVLDEEPNFYYYSKEKLVRADLMFKEFVESLMELKKKYKPFKNILNSLWGMLCKKDYFKKNLRNDTEYNINEEDAELTKIIKVDENVTTFEYEKTRKFSSNFGRVSIITSYGRYRLFNMIKNYSNNIIRINTDSVIFDEDIKIDFIVNDEIGNFKIENKGALTINSLNKYNFN